MLTVRNLIDDLEAATNAVIKRLRMQDETIRVLESYNDELLAELKRKDEAAS